MRIFRFDPEVSVPVSRFGSQFRIGPLTGEGSRVRVQIMHLPAGGLIGRHETVLRQLLAVVSGEGEASGAEGRWRRLRAGNAALWEPGEPHEARSDSGFAAVCIEGEFEVRAVAVTSDIVVSEHDPEWTTWFERVRSHVWPAVAHLAVRIDHVGSTAVPGLAAKPIVDMDVVVASEELVAPAIEALGALGYRWRGDLGVPGRQAFDPPPGPGLPPHHLYLVVEDNKAHLDHWLLRDLLRSDPDARARYAALKRANADLADGDLDVYVAAKAALVAELLARARSERGLAPAEYWVPDA